MTKPNEHKYSNHHPTTTNLLLGEMWRYRSMKSVSTLPKGTKVLCGRDRTQLPFSPSIFPLLLCVSVLC